jgi:iron-sulfur cluster assembly protein
LIQITEQAASHISKMLAKRALGETALRLGIKAGGCSGLEYVFTWERSPRSSDLIVDGPLGVRVVVDPKSLEYLDGTVLDYDTNLVSKGFIVNNPRAKSTCGCGVSFGV